MGVEPKEELSGARTAEELASLVRRSASEGRLDNDTATLLSRTLAFSQHTAQDVMTPRPRVAAVERGDSAQAVIEQLRRIPGLSVLVLGAGLVLTGMFVTNMFGQWSVRQWDTLMGRIPIVKSIYNSVKQVSDTLFSSNGNAFREAVLVQYPRAGSWTIAFITGRPGGEVAEHLAGDFVSVYVPTTPNPTSGFFLMMPRADVLRLKMSVDEALKYVISMGVVAPASAVPGLVRPVRN
jgi:uncharacterized membrane protein